ncbi:MAG: histidinol dehydrogenase, partial [Miltoncostaeaceae bacterium]
MSRITADPADPAGDCARLRAGSAPAPEAAVAEALADVRARGDAAVIDAVRRFDAPDFAATSPVVEPAQVDAAARALGPRLRDAVLFAAEQVRTVAEAGR